MLSCVAALSLISLVNCFTDVTVTLRDGPVIGRATELNQVFLGVPYAAPPVGALRWSAPQAPSPWKPNAINATVRNAPGCPQKCILPALECPQRMSEDCLYLDVFAPSQAAFRRNPSKRPVMVFFAGGGFFQGGNVDLYRADYLVNATDVIVVTPQYRLGALGFLVWADGNGNMPIVGNYGLQDQRRALHWVQDNIAAFGGDPSRVTLFGQSAGAMSIGIHLISPASQGLFHGAIMQSNPLGLPYKTAQEQTAWGAAFASKVGCSDVACLRALNSTQIGVAENGVVHVDFDHPLAMALVWTPNIDGPGGQFPMAPLVAFKQGLAAKVPVIMGTVQNEGNIFVYEIVQHIDDVEYAAILVGLFGLRAYEVWQQYPPSSILGDQFQLASRLVTDFVFECSTRHAMHSLADGNGDNAWLYRFNQMLSFSKWAWGANFPECWDEVCHGEELPYIFNPIRFVPPANFTAEERALSALMQTFWSNMAIAGNPNQPSAPLAWPSIRSKGKSSDVEMLFKGTVSKPDVYNQAHCDFWSSFY
jgi:carboxylesterase type B